MRARTIPGGREVWGWRGRTLGHPVTTPHGHAWLRLHSAPTNEIIDTVWNGAIDAERSIPASIPRPRLLTWHDWTDPTHSYRAELYEHVTACPVTYQVPLTNDPDLPSTWWAAARRALDNLAKVPTDRITLHRGFLAWAMPYYLNVEIASQATVPWTTAHGDFHYANLCAPDLNVLDWEGWGTAPAGYDAAMLHSHSLLVPALAARVRHEFTDILDTNTGRFAELTVITELLHTATYGGIHNLVEPLRRCAANLLGHAVPVVDRRPAGY